MLADCDLAAATHPHDVRLATQLLLLVERTLADGYCYLGRCFGHLHV